MNSHQTSLQHQYLQSFNSKKPLPLTWKQHWRLFWIGPIKLGDGNHCPRCGSKGNMHGIIMSIRLKQCIECMSWFKF